MLIRERKGKWGKKKEKPLNLYTMVSYSLYTQTGAKPETLASTAKDNLFNF